MVKNIISLILLSACLFSAAAQTVPADSVVTIDGNSISLSQYAGKKIMLIVIPVSHNEADSLLLLQTETVYQQYKDSIEFIGIPSYEDGYTDSVSTEIKNWYGNTLQLHFTITTGMYTRNSSSEQQSWLFKWLTTESLNGHFGTEVTGNWQKFLLNASGELKAVFDSTTPLSSYLLNMLMNTE